MSLYETSKKTFSWQFVLCALVLISVAPALFPEVPGMLPVLGAGLLIVGIWATCFTVFQPRDWKPQGRERWVVSRIINEEREVMRREGLFLDLNSPENRTEWRSLATECYTDRKKRLATFGERPLSAEEQKEVFLDFPPSSPSV